MAEYKALAQNTLKITTEMTLNHNTELGAPLVHNHPRVKLIKSGNAEVVYENLIPSIIKSNAAKTKFESKNGSYNASSNAEGAIQIAVYKIVDYYTAEEAIPVVVEGVKYHGQKSAFYSGKLRKIGGSYKGSNATVSSRGTYPGFKVKTVMYSVAAGSIVTKEAQVTAYMSASASSGSPGTSYYGGAAAIDGLLLQKEENDIVLAIEIEYPKYDLTISGTGLQYSLDDGLTFQDVTDNMILSQVEHVVFKNTGSAAKTIGTTQGAAEVGTIAAGKTFVAVPEADGTWFIS